MTQSRLSKKCKECPFVEKCECKRMEALGEVANEVAADAAQPVLRETKTIYTDGTPKVVYVDDIEKELMKSLELPGLSLQYGA